jgi:hypothetical protein
MKQLTPEEMKMISGGAVFPSSPQQLIRFIEDLFRLLGGDLGRDPGLISTR